MNNQPELLPRKRGIVINFPKLTERQLNNMINDVGLTLSVTQLKELQKHYRTVEKRDPTLDELYFLDEYFTTRDCRNHTVSDLITNSKAIAETYADLMEKREAVTGSDAPPTVGELSALPSKYLASRGKEYTLDAQKNKKSLHHALTLSGRDAELRLLSEGYDTVCKTPVGAVGVKSAKKQKAPKFKKGDFLLLISPAPEMSTKDFTAALADPLLSLCGNSLTMTIPTGEQTIVDAVSSIPCGVYIDLDALYEDNTAVAELTDLCRRPYGVITVVKAYDILDIIKLTTATKLRATVIGSLIKKNHIAVKHGNYPLVTFSRKLLTAITTDERLSIRHNGNTPTGRLVANFRTLSTPHSISLASAESQIMPDTSPYLTALYTALTAMAQCVASGADYTDISLSYDIPKNLSTSDTLAAVLGLYRAEIELCTPDKEDRIGIRGDRLAVSAGAKLKNVPNPALLCKPGNRVYLLLPRYNAEGLPDFEDMRRMWRYLRTICREGSVSSAFAVGHDGAAVALKAISTRCDFVPLPDLDPALLEKCAAGGFVVETCLPIEGILIGHSTEKAEISQ